MHATLTLKLITSVNDYYGVVITMIKNILFSSYSKSTYAQKWMDAVSGLHEGEQVHIMRAACSVEQGYPATPRRPRGNGVGGGFNNADALSLGVVGCREKRYFNCNSLDHLKNDYPLPLKEKVQYHRTCAG